VLVATKKAAAIGQLESAILLWFYKADPLSILVLASRFRSGRNIFRTSSNMVSWT
jgi:hypothetical protein